MGAPAAAIAVLPPAAHTQSFTIADNNSFEGTYTGIDSAPVLGDLDGNLDALVGEGNGALTIFQNGSSTVLPVELAAFSAAADGQAALLRWRTASETANQDFEVHRLLGGSASYSAAVEVEIGVGGAYRLSARLYDMLGRQVATVYEGTLRPGASQALEVPTGRLAPGLYVVQVRGQEWTASRKVMVVR